MARRDLGERLENWGLGVRDMESQRSAQAREGFRLEDFLLPCLTSSELGELESGRAAGWGELQVGKVATGKGGRD